MRHLHFLTCLIICLNLIGCGQGTEPEASLSTFTQSRSLASTAVDQEILRIAGYRNNYTISISRNDNRLTLTNKITGEVIVGVIRPVVRFVDQDAYLTTDGPAADVYRMYQAAFARKPDLEGLGFWIHTHKTGVDLLSIARELVVSAEFRERYGNQLTDKQFVEQLYQNVLLRPGDPSGVEWWLTQLRGGAERWLLLREFANSAENKANVNSEIENGFDVAPYGLNGPLPIKRSSFENRAAAMAAVGPVNLPTFGGQEVIGPSYALADFFQDGTYSMVVNTGDFSRGSAADGYATKPGKIRFFRMKNGNWVESNETIVDDQTGCISGRKLVVADFNGDGKPDVFIACTGLDTMSSPGEHSRFLMSQSNGIYTNKVTAFKCYCHSASAADVNKNGYADLVIADVGTELTPYYLVNNKDGTFTQDFKRMPDSVAKFSYPGQSTINAKQIYTIELVDFERRGKYDLFVGANEPNSFVVPVPKDSPNYYLSSFYRNDGNNHFPEAGRLEIPNLDPTYGLPLDIAVYGNKVYLLRVISDHASPHGFYGGMAIQEVAYPSLEGSTIHKHLGSYHPSENGGNWYWFPWLGVQDGKLKSADAGYDVVIPLH